MTADVGGYLPLFPRNDAVPGIHRQAPFPSPQSARWWLRLHGVEAIELGALIRHTGKWFFDPEKLRVACIEIGRREARQVTLKDQPSFELGAKA